MTPRLPGYKITENIYEGTRTLVYRGVRSSDSLKVVIKFLRHSYPSFSELVQFRNQYAITKNLDRAGILRPLSLERYGNGYALVMPDLGAISLEKAVAEDESLDLGSCLDIAIQLAEILQELDRQRVIHKDIKPANILICPGTKQVKLIDFSIASLLPREAQEIKNFNVLEGTLAYISPEQTGRMNRGIDYRSDFYSLGATLYELLTGVLPFASDDPMELVHCHISQQPVPPAARNSVCQRNSQTNPASPRNYQTNPVSPRNSQTNPASPRNSQTNPVSPRRRVFEIPPVVSDIVMKLMAKNAEDRYQSALGLKLDLENCLKQWQETGKIEAFELATRDISGRFLIPEKLYGREREVETLLAAFERVANGKTEMMLVAGFSGIGKTAVVNEVHKPIVKQRGYFVKGKFDQFNRSIPFSAFVQAFRSLMGQILGESDTELQKWKRKILEAVGTNGQVLVDVIPELEKVIGKQPAAPELSGSAAQNRFNLLFEKFIAAFTTKEHPLVIFLDDLQWSDSASLNLIEVLVGNSNTGYLLLLGAYRDNEVFPAHPLMLTLADLARQEAAVSTVKLASLYLHHINQLVAETLSCQLEYSQRLTELVCQKTQGNPFFTNQFLKGLYEEELIVFNLDLGYWECDLVRVRDAALTDDVVEFMAGRLQKLSATTQQVLKLAACIGNQFDLETLAIASEGRQEEVATHLWRALQEGLVLPISEAYKFFQGSLAESNLETITAGYRFLHDRVQQAAYSLIPDDQKQTAHYRIGQLLLEKIPPSHREERIFELVGQLNYGTALIREQPARDELAQLNLIAVRKAKAATAYEAGRNYAEMGLALLGKQGWESKYEMTLELHNLAAELASLCGDWEAMAELIQIVMTRAKSVLDLVNVYKTKIVANTYQNELLEAIAIGKEVLQALGVTFPDIPDESDIQQAAGEIDKAIGEREIRELVDLPVMADSQQKAIVEIANLISTPAYLCGSSVLYILLIAKIIAISLDYGNTSTAADSYTIYATVVCNIFKNVNKGIEFAELALELIAKLDDKATKAALMIPMTVSIWPRKGHVRETVPALRDNYVLALETGRLEKAGHSAHGIALYALLSGLSLSETEQELQSYILQLVQLNQLATASYCGICRQVCLNLLGTNSHPDLLAEDKAQETELLDRLSGSNDLMGLSTSSLYKLMLCYLFEDIESALAAALEAKKYAIGTMGMMTQPCLYLYDSLTALAGWQHQSLSSSEALQRVAENQAELQDHWIPGAPMNFEHKWHLVEAEKYRLLGEKVEAIEHYDRAIAGAKENEFVQEEALANELAAKFYLDWGKEKVAASYMTDAYYCYARWGAKAKTDQLSEKYPQLLVPILQQSRLQFASGETVTSTLTSALTQTAAPSNSKTEFMLDWTTAMKAAQSLSSEIHLDNLVSALMKAAMENAGADRSILLLQRLSGWQIAARCSGDVCSFEPTEGEIPTSVINKVKHSQKIIIVNDLPRDRQFAAEPYLLQGQPKSFLCAPILDRGKLIGVLYLENHLAVGAFTSDRVSLLNMLCSQAAISLENARLYQQSQDYAQKLEKSLADLQQAQLQLVQNEKMSALGNLVAGVAHEINNPVVFIAGNLEPARYYLEDLFGLIDLYQQKYPEPDADIEAEIKAIDLQFIREDLPQLISSMREGTKRISHISNSLRTFSRTDKEHKVPFDIHQGIDSTLLILKHRLKSNEWRPTIEIFKDYGDLPEVQCFPGQINQVFMNLIANAIDALESANEGRSFDEIAANPNRIVIKTEAKEEEVTIRIADNGTGMPEEVKQRIFEQGFTTKAVGKGTGLGMAIAHQIVEEKHGGRILCSSELGKGTELAIAIPIAVLK
ncbi:MAG: AAA family ATPase [Oscillatoria sp. SIO1A7]|nr:AAA family ATPase [Oscillatoria sp. SIO1A7]